MIEVHTKIPVSFQIDVQILNQLKALARERALKYSRDFNWADMTREAIEIFLQSNAKGVK